MRYARDNEEETPGIRRLRRLVMALMVVLMLSILAIAATIVIRLGLGAGGPVAADRFDLPMGQVVGLGRGEGTVLFLVRGQDGQERLYTFDATEGGPPLSVTDIARE